MATARLLHVKTTFVRVEIHGPLVSRWGTVQDTDRLPAYLAIESSDHSAVVEWVHLDGKQDAGSGKGGGPYFFEDTLYRLRIKSLRPGITPVPIHRDPSLFQNVDSYPDDSMCASPINFLRQVGRSTIDIRVGHENLRITIEVFPVKLDYERDYHRLLLDVASAGRALAFAYLRATYRSGSSEEAEHTSHLEWLTLLRNEIGNLERAVAYINDHPHRSLIRDIEITPLEKIRHLDAIARHAVSKGQGHGQWTNIPGVGKVRQRIPSLRNAETFDTPENRWIRLYLELIYFRLTSLYESLVAEVKRYQSSTPLIPKRLEVEQQELLSFIQIIIRLLALPLFNDVQNTPPTAFASLTLLNGAGYSEAYRAIMILRQGLNVAGEPFAISVIDVHELYETWCFIEIFRLIAQLSGGQADAGAMLQIEEAGIRINLKHGKHGSINYQGPSGNQTVTVSYNPDYPGLTGNQRPDIVLRFQHEGWPELVVVLDAKYRLDASEGYKKRFGCAGPPQDAMNALHRYRDAIIVDTVTRGFHRPVVKGIALFPLSTEESSSFTSSSFYEALGVLGIGALPFLPSNTSLVKSWLNYLLKLPPEEMAEPGPPFSGLAEKERRKISSPTNN